MKLAIGIVVGLALGALMPVRADVGSSLAIAERIARAIEANTAATQAVARATEKCR